MKNLSKKSVLLFGVVMALCAFAVPSIASAGTWGLVNSTHALSSTDLSFTATNALFGQITSGCASSTFTTNVNANGSAIEVTAASFTNCTGTGPGIGDCTVTPKPTGLPWTATGPSTSNVQIHGIHIDVWFETKPGGAPGSCALHNQNITLTGTLTGGSWDIAAHQVTFSHDDGLVGHSAAGHDAAFVTGAIRDNAQTLTLGD